MPAFDSLQRASFGNVAFPIESCHVRSSLRKHNHEYPPAPGASVEKMGRTPYTIEMMGNFQNTFVGYPTLWPQGVAILRNHFENEKTLPLVIPTIGTIKAYLTEWDQSMDARIRSGEKCALKFEEDFESQFVKNQLTKVTSNNLQSATAKFDASAKERPPVPSIFTQITDSANSILAIKDQGDLQMALFDSKLQGLLALLKQADRQVQELQDPDNIVLIESMLELWSTVVDIANNLKNEVISPRDWKTPQQMTTFEIASAIYDGDGSRGGDILALNVFEDPFAVPAGTKIRYYPDLAA